MNKYDVIIIGGACAGLSAALYSARRAMKTLVLTKDIGGQIASATVVENYPGTGEIGGTLLANKMKEQAEKYGAEIKFDEVTKIEKQADGSFVLKTMSGEYQALSIVLAFGLEHRKLNVPGEKELAGRGIVYCATCDGPLFKNKTVGIVGGGNSAFDAADYMADLAAKVYLIVRKGEAAYRAEKTLINSVLKNEKIEILNYTEVKEIKGENKVEKVLLLNNQTKETKELNLDAVFVEIGYQTKTDFLQDLVDLNERGYITVDHASKTSTKGIFAAGDVTETPFKQAVISAGEGAKAALSATKYVKELKGESAEVFQDRAEKKELK